LSPRAASGPWIGNERDREGTGQLLAIQREPGRIDEHGRRVPVGLAKIGRGAQGAGPFPILADQIAIEPLGLAVLRLAGEVAFKDDRVLGILRIGLGLGPVRQGGQKTQTQNTATRNDTDHVSSPL
jgi:hypothetical protein